MWLICAIVVFLLVILKWYLERRKIIKSLESIPGPFPLPFIGNALDLVSPKDLLQQLIKYKEKYGGIVKVWVGSTPSVLFVMDYKFTEFLLSSTEVLNKSKEYKFLNTWLGTGLLSSDGDTKWKNHRKVLGQAFHFKVLAKFPEVFKDPLSTLVKKLQNEVGKSSTKISTFIKLCALDIICESVMGASINAQENSNSDYVKSVEAMCRIIIDRSFNPFLQNPLTYLLSKQHYIEKKAVKVLHEYVDGIIRRKQKEFENNFNINSSIGEITKKKKLAFVDLLLFEKLQNASLTYENIREEVDTFMFAGHDTMAQAIAFCIFCLSENQDVQRKVVTEIEDVLQDSTSSFAAYNDLQQMKYLEAVIKETLRLYPPVPYFARDVHKVFEYDGVTFPKGLSLTIVPYVIHRSEEFYPNAETFDPNRFLTENITAPFCYIPFSMGPRNCIALQEQGAHIDHHIYKKFESLHKQTPESCIEITRGRSRTQFRYRPATKAVFVPELKGQKFAMLAMKSVISTIIRNFEILPTSPKHTLELVAETVLTSSNGVCVRLINRQC